MKKILFSVLGIAAVSLGFTFGGELPIGADLPKADLKMKDIRAKRSV